jgi:hypothetical protein
MEDKRGTKCARSPSTKGSSSPCGGSIPPLAPSRSPPPPGSPSEISSHRPCSPVFEQGDPSKKVLVVDLSSSSHEECLIPDILRDEEFTKKLFGDLNHDVLGPPSDCKIIVLCDFVEEEEEVREEKTTDTKTAATSAAVNPISTTFADVNDAPARVKMIIVMIAPSIKRLTAATTAERAPGCLRLPRQKGA